MIPLKVVISVKVKTIKVCSERVVLSTKGEHVALAVCWTFLESANSLLIVTFFRTAFFDESKKCDQIWISGVLQLSGHINPNF